MVRPTSPLVLTGGRVIINQDSDSWWYVACQFGSRDALQEIAALNLTLNRTEFIRIKDCRTESYTALLRTGTADHV